MTKPAEDLKLTPEQQKAVMDAMATVTQVVSEVITGVTEAIMPIIKAYNALPEELKQELAKAQVQQHLKDSLQAMPIGIISTDEKTKNPELAAIESAGLTNMKGDYMHGVDVSSKGVVNVYHFSDCEGGEDCKLFKFIEANETPELKRPKSGTQDYWVTKDAAGKFIFKKQTPKGASK